MEISRTGGRKLLKMSPGYSRRGTLRSSGGKGGATSGLTLA
jgi:hypothetical protein